MAGARAAASLSLTIGVAFVTVLIVGGILAGPTILDCSHQPQSFGVCLRDHLDHSQLVPVRDEPGQVPVLSSELSTPSEPLPPAHQADSGHPEGWLDARANEYEPPATSALEPRVPPPLPELVTPPALPPVSSSAIAEIGPIAPPPLPPLVTPAPLPVPTDTSSSAVAEIELLPPPLPHQRPVLTTLRPKAEIKRPVAKPARVARLTPRPAPKLKLPPTFKNDPRFPNVTVLPPPATGGNSSFVTLQTH